MSCTTAPVSASDSATTSVAVTRSPSRFPAAQLARCAQLPTSIRSDQAGTLRTDSGWFAAEEVGDQSCGDGLAGGAFDVEELARWVDLEEHVLATRSES